MLLRFAFDLQFAIASILFQLCRAPYAPLKFVETAFAVTDLGGGDDLHSDLLDELLKLAPSPSCQDARSSRSYPARIAKHSWSESGAPCGALRRPAGGLSSAMATRVWWTATLISRASRHLTSG